MCMRVAAKTRCTVHGSHISLPPQTHTIACVFVCVCVWRRVPADAGTASGSTEAVCMYVLYTRSVQKYNYELAHKYL